MLEARCTESSSQCNAIRSLSVSKQRMLNANLMKTKRHGSTAASHLTTSGMVCSRTVEFFTSHREYMIRVTDQIIEQT